MISKLHLLFRVISIYVITILLGTVIAASIIEITNQGGGIEWIGFLLVGLLFTGGASLPNIPLLFLGHYLIYRKVKTQQNRLLGLIGMGLFICLIPVSLFSFFWFSPSTFSQSAMDSETIFLLSLSIPYAIIALLSIIGINLIFDRRKRIEDIYEGDENILDDIIP